MTSATVPTDIVRTVIWQSLDPPGAEHARLRHTDSGAWLLEGTVVTSLQGIPARVRYSIRMEMDWVTRRVVIEQIHGSKLYRAILNRDVRGWRALTSDVALPDLLPDCVDIALSITPATYTLPIRRLKLNVGETADISVLSLRFPDLQAEARALRYIRLEEKRYRCENPIGAQRVTIEVDDQGLLVVERDRWRRVSAQ